MAKLSPPRGVKLATAHRPHDPPASFSAIFPFRFFRCEDLLGVAISYNELGMFTAAARGIQSLSAQHGAVQAYVTEIMLLPVFAACPQSEHIAATGTSGR